MEARKLCPPETFSVIKLLFNSIADVVAEMET